MQNSFDRAVIYFDLRGEQSNIWSVFLLLSVLLFLCHSGTRLLDSFCSFKLIGLLIVCDITIFFKLWLTKFFLSLMPPFLCLFCLFFFNLMCSIAVFYPPASTRFIFHPHFSNYAFEQQWSIFELFPLSLILVLIPLLCDLNPSCFQLLKRFLVSVCYLHLYIDGFGTEVACGHLCLSKCCGFLGLFLF